MKLNEQVSRIRKMMGLNESFFDLFKSDDSTYKDVDTPDEAEEARFTCQDCGEKDYKMYYVNDDLWKKYGNEKLTLCRSCLEKRMGRELTKDDISQHKDALVNIHNTDFEDFYR